MTYMIKISQTGDPKLVKVPEKPNPDLEKYVGDSMLWDEDWEEYKQALASALADESKHISFKNPDEVKKLIRKKCTCICHSGATIMHMFPCCDTEGYNFLHEFSIHDMPTGWRVEFEEEEESCENKCGRESCMFVCEYPKVNRLAILLPEQPEESHDEHKIKTDCRCGKYTGCTYPKCKEGDLEQPEEKKEPVIISGLKKKIEELENRKSDYWIGVRDGYKSALEFILSNPS